jgi:hypothetical protein
MDIANKMEASKDQQPKKAEVKINSKINID